MKYFILLAFSLIVSASYAQKEEVCYNPNSIKDTTKKSIKSVAEAKIGSTDFTINYHSPGVRKRIIWGGLVPYDEVWVTGAHNATTITFNKNIIVSTVEIPAGKYAIFTIPGEQEWTFIINKHWNQHLASEYDEKDDVVRVKVKPSEVQHLERLQYFIEAGEGKTGSIFVIWEKKKVSLPFKVL